MTIIKKRTINARETGTVMLYWWEFKMIQSPCKTTWYFLKELNIALP
jgi:hypothetical protein